MNALTYESPGSLDEAVKLLAAAKGNAKVLAGGTDLLVQLRMGMIKPAMIIDIKKIPELTAINEENGGYRVGNQNIANDTWRHVAAVLPNGATEINQIIS